jgi:hypothetical protein
MSVNLSPVGNGFQFFTNNGEPLVGGKLDTYQAGSTTPLTTFTDSSGLIPNTNPIILGTDGRPPDTIWLSEGFFYKFVLSDADDVQIQVYDNLYGIIGVSPPAATPIPSGGILLWSGSIGSIPAGYVLCNGNNSTPDLRDRFIVGAGSTYAVDATGGSADATLPTHTHTATSTSVVTDPGHNHNYTTTIGGVEQRAISIWWWKCCKSSHQLVQQLESQSPQQPLMLTQEPLAPTLTSPRTMRFAT